MGRFETLRSVLAIALFVCASVQSEECNLNDPECVTQAMINVSKRKDFIEAIDPLNFKKISGDILTVHYDITNITVTKLSKCNVISLKFFGDERITYEYEIQCPEMDVVYDFDLKGSVSEANNFKLKGHAKVAVADYLIKMQGNCDEYFSEKDKKARIGFRDMKLDAELVGNYKFETLQVTEGDQKLVDIGRKFVRSLGKSAETLVRYPVAETIFNKYMKKFNSFLDDNPLNEVFVDGN